MSPSPRFNILISVPSDVSEEDIKSLLPPIPELHLKKNHSLDSSVLFKWNNNIALHLIWISRETCESAIRWQRQQADYDFNKKTIWIGQDVAPKLALTLGQLRIRDFFDIERDHRSILDRILTSYEQWRKTLFRKPPSELDLDKALIGNCDQIKKLRELIKIASSKERLMILLRGETGTGKGFVAKLIHHRSPRTDRPFVEINCTAIPDTLVETELFGHERGAFTDAHKTRKGIFELAHKGTLFLDEIGYLKQEIQVKLLKVLEDKRFRRVGGERDIEVDCRIITGTSVDLEDAVEKKVFRSDLYYRLNVFPIWMPPLRDRGEDILLLTDYFIDLFSKEHSVNVKGLTAEAKTAIRRYPWPGNIRELKHAVERAVILCDGTAITEEAILPNLSRKTVQATVQADEPGYEITIQIPESGKSMDVIQREIIQHVLQLTGNNRSQAAKLLKISRSRLLRRLNQDES